MEPLIIRYRPKTLDEFLGNEKVVDSLKPILRQPKGRPQAYLFTGPTGVGKTTLARIMARKLNNIQGPIDSISGVKEFNGASNRGIETIRKIIRTSMYAAMKGDYRIIVFDEAHGLTPDAQEAFLKPLEEPPPHIICIFCTTDPGKLITTLKGRLKHYVLSPLSTDDVIALLKKVNDKEKGGLSQDVLEGIAEESKGEPRKALMLLDEQLPEKEIIEEEQLHEKEIKIQPKKEEPKRYMKSLHGLTFLLKDKRDIEDFKFLISSDVFPTPYNERAFNKLRNKNIVILQDRNDQGREWAEGIYADVKDISKTVKIIEPWGDAVTFGDMVRRNFPNGYDLPKPEGFKIDREYMSASLMKQTFRNCFYSAIEDPDNLEYASLLTVPEQSFRTGAEFKALDIPEPKLLLDPWLMEGNLTLLAAKPGVGKTLFTMEIAEAVASGKDAFDGLWTTERPVPVLYVDGEMHPYDIQNRIMDQDIEHTVFFSKMLYDAENWPIEFNLLNEPIRDFLTEQVQEQEIKLIVLDNLYSLLTGVDHRFDTHWSPINQWLLNFRKLGVAVILIHHSTKQGKQFGNALRTANLDYSFELEEYETEDIDPENSAAFTINIDKHRRPVTKIKGNAFIFQDNEWQIRETGESRSGSAIHAEAEDKRRKIASLLVEGLMGKEIAEKIGVTAPHVTQTKNKLVKEEYLTEIEDGKKKKYEFTEDGQAWFDQGQDQIN